VKYRPFRLASGATKLRKVGGTRHFKLVGGRHGHMDFEHILAYNTTF
jgi:hypothetical protein